MPRSARLDASRALHHIIIREIERKQIFKDDNDRAECDVLPEDIFSKSRQKVKVKARSLFCYWAARKLGISRTERARHLRVSAPAVSYAVERGEAIAQKDKCKLISQ